MSENSKARGGAGMSRAPQLDEIGILIAALQKSKAANGWIVVRNIEEVPAAVGQYVLYDGFDSRSGGYSWNMRKSLQGSRWIDRCEKPIYMYLPDKDGSIANYLREAGFHE